MPVEPAAPPLVAPLSQVARVVDAYIAPSKTFQDILRSSAWWLPFLLLVLGGLALGFTLDRQVGFDRVVANQVKASPSAQDRMNQIPAEQRAPAMARQAAVTRYLTYGSALPILVFFAVYSLLLWASFNFGLGATLRFPQVFAVVVYAALPYLIRTLVTMLILFFGADAESFDLKNPVGSNPAFYLPDAAPWLRALLSRADVFELWVLALMVLGMAIVARKTIAQSATVVLGLYLLATLLYVGAAAAF